MNRIRGVVLDLDGVLFDSEPIHRMAWMRTMESLGNPVEEHSLLRWTGIPCRLLAEHYAETIEPRREPDIYETQKGQAFRAIAAERLRAFSGVPELVARVSRELRAAFATSNTREDAELMLEVSGLRRYFVGGVTYDDVERHKPEPDPYLAAARLLSVAPDECAAVEDSEAGIRSAAAAGMTVLAVASSLSRDEIPEAGAEHVFESTEEALEWLLGRSAQRARLG